MPAEIAGATLELLAPAAPADVPTDRGASAG
jgi:hypothetical protein